MTFAVDWALSNNYLSIYPLEGRAFAAKTNMSVFCGWARKIGENTLKWISVEKNRNAWPPAVRIRYLQHRRTLSSQMWRCEMDSVCKTRPAWVPFGENVTMDKIKTIKACGRPHDQLNVNKIRKWTYLCGKVGWLWELYEHSISDTFDEQGLKFEGT